MDTPLECFCKVLGAEQSPPAVSNHRNLRAVTAETGRQRRIISQSCGGLPVHRFPNPDTNAEKFNRRISKIGGHVATVNALDVYSNRCVCHKHLEDIYKYSRNRLSKLAIPVLFTRYLCNFDKT